MTPPRLDAYGHRCAPGFHQLAVTADLVPDKDRLVKDHPVNRHRRASPTSPPGRQRAAGEIHLREQPAAEYVAVRVRIGRHRHHANERHTLWQSRQSEPPLTALGLRSHGPSKF